MMNPIRMVLFTVGLGLLATMEGRAELLAWWPFDTAKSPGRDASPRGQEPLVFLSGAGELVEGREPGALAWSTAGVDFGLQKEFPMTRAFTFSTWVRREPGQPGGQTETVVRLGDRNQAGWAVYVGDNGNWTVYAYGAQTRRLDSRVVAAAGAWTHLAVTFAPVGAAEPGALMEGRLCLYVDGRLANEGVFRIGVADDLAPLMLGARYVKGAISWPFHGQISQAAVWDEPLPPSVVGDLAKGVTPGRATISR